MTPATPDVRLRDRPAVRLSVLVAGVLVGALLVTETAMAPTPQDRSTLTAIYVSAGLVTVVLYLVASRRLRTVSSFRAAVQLVSLSSLVVAAVSVVLAAQTMFIGDHDRDLVLVVLALGVGLGSALAVAVGAAMSADIRRLAAAAEAVASGDLTIATGVERRDELGEVAVAFDRMVGRLAANEEERRVFLAAVGHDLRTPIAGLRAVLEAAEDGLIELDTARAVAMGRDVDHLGRLVEDLFLFARTEAGRYEPQRESVDLAELCDEAVEAIGPAAARRDVRVVAETRGAVPVVVDPGALRRVLRNLLANAVRHAPSATEVRIEVSSGTAPGFSVHDAGPGFPPAFRDRAFDRFTRGDEARSRDHGGAGLGLAIARGLVEAHGAEIRIGDGPGGHVVVTGLPTA
jgi:signal transduction histidine kinase